MTIRTPYVIAACIGFLGGVAIASFAYTTNWLPSLALVAILGAMGAIIAWEIGGRYRLIALVVV
ncbi:MAG: hypothetical protein Q8R16_01835, partial [bacterium]|nr:hypothetical protein [bacterium]